eukprot:CAMPEP_0172189986 /NCGR_PEP_ID=MMETSP1050-20130122/22851_1 /TAXON_ID=233186 /ORGANISM="Cryptomonas curvata, Strain CCAP979/52" /LENGTH=60 /DNA_ID=CAMNT_0012864787 /DNA_START=52 /DNA_END=234 /DNA_ORIENTATION=-
MARKVMTQELLGLGQHVPWPESEKVEISPPYPAVVVARDSDGIITIPCFQPFDPSQPYTI